MNLNCFGFIPIMIYIIMKKGALIIELIAFAFVLLFLYAAGSKIVEYDRFILQMSMSPLLTNLADLMAWLIPVIEIVIAIMLIVPRFRRWGFYSAYALMLLFTFYIGVILLTSAELPCACGGILAMLGWKTHFVFNIMFVMLGLLGIVLVDKDSNTKISSRP